MPSREARQVAALVDLLQALPESQLEMVLDGLGIPPARREAAGRKPDKRRCTHCGQGWWRCTNLPAYADHEFQEHLRPADPERVRELLATDPADIGPTATEARDQAADDFHAEVIEGRRP